MSLAPGSKLLIIDLCHTIILENTTNSFLDNWLIHDPWRRALRRLFGGKRPTSAVALLGLSKSFLYEEAERYARNRLITISNPPSLEAIFCARAQHIPVFLATATLDPIAYGVAHCLGLQGVVCTQLGYSRSGLCCGYIAREAAGRKLKYLRRVLSEHLLRHATVYTDNYEDTDLIRTCLHTFFGGERAVLSRVHNLDFSKVTFLS